MASVLADDLDQTVHTEKTPVHTWRFAFGPANAALSVYEIDLTPENFDALQEALSKYTAVAREAGKQLTATPSGNGTTKKQEGTETGDAAPSNLPRGAKSLFSTAKKDQMDTFREWAKGKGQDLPAKGAPKQSIIDEFFKDNDGLPVLIGRNTISIEDWHASQQESAA